MPVESAADLLGMYGDFGETATLTIAGQTLPARKVLPQEPRDEALGIKAVASTLIVRLIAAGLPAAPRRGDTIAFRGIVYRVAEAHMAPSGAEHFCTLER
jgi:hypothetical protein